MDSSDVSKDPEQAFPSIVALFVDSDGIYPKCVDTWFDEARDARNYLGPHPVIAHPPCSRWCRLAGLVEARWGYRRGDDGGCFQHALAAVRNCGGVLEHPAYSDAWPAFGLPKPARTGGWSEPDAFGGRSCHVEQGRYGHRAKKATWLYACHVEFHDLRWGHVSDRKSSALISWCGNRVSSGERRPRLSQREASATPPAFCNELLRLARSVSRASPQAPRSPRP